MTNLVAGPEDLGGANWSELLDCDVTPNTHLAPDDTMTADTIGDDGVQDTGQVAIQQGMTLAINTQYAFAGFFKPGGEDWVYFRPLNWGSLSTAGYFNVATGEIGTLGGDLDAAYITGPYTNDFFRVEVVFTTDGVDPSGNLRLHVSRENDHTGLPVDGTSNIIAWGISCNVGSRADPYTSQGGTVIELPGTRNIITAFRRRADQMIVRPRMPKPRNSLRGSFE